MQVPIIQKPLFLRRDFILMTVFFALVLWAGNAPAIPLGNQITIYDGITSGSVSGPYYGSAPLHEDREVEPGCYYAQVWDLEGFFLNGSILTMVGGYDFKDGYDIWKPGDIFLDMNGDAQYGFGAYGTGGGTIEVNDTFNYEYALVLSFNDDVEAIPGGSGIGMGTGTYQILSLDPQDTILKVWYTQNEESNPWIYGSGGSDAGSGNFIFWENLPDSEVGGLNGDWDGNWQYDKDFNKHYAVQLTLTSELQNFKIAHYTYECGNDNLMGHNIPDPTGLVLLGSGMLIVGLGGRKKLFQMEA